MAKEDIVGIVNSDDGLGPETLRLVADKWDELGKADIVITGDILCHYKDDSEQVIKYPPITLKHYAKEYRMGVNHPATFVPLSLCNKFGVFDTNLKLQADADFINRLYLSGVKFIFIDKILSNQSDGGASTKNMKQSLHDYKYILHKSEISKLNHAYLYFKYWTLCYVKSLMPVSILKRYRIQTLFNNIQ